MGKGEIARYEQFLLFPQCFQNACFPGVSKGVIVWEWVKANLCLLLDVEFCLKHHISETIQNSEKSSMMSSCTIALHYILYRYIIIARDTSTHFTC